MTMLGTAEIVADRYEISREAQDVYALRSQQRTAAALAAGRFDAEIAPIATTMTVVDKASGATSQKQVRLAKDEGARADTTLEGLASLNPVFADGMRVKVGRNITAGNASQLSDGASACVIMEAKEAERRGLQPLGIYRGIAVALQPRRNGHRPVFAIPKLLKEHGLKVTSSLVRFHHQMCVRATVGCVFTPGVASARRPRCSWWHRRSEG
jgi:acetyl-CoA C-acetyltransferase